MDLYERAEAALVHNRAQPFRGISTDLWMNILSQPALEEEDVARLAVTCRYFSVFHDVMPLRPAFSTREQRMLDDGVSAMLSTHFHHIANACVHCNQSVKGTPMFVIANARCKHLFCKRCIDVAQDDSCGHGRRPIYLEDDLIEVELCPVCRHKNAMHEKIDRLEKHRVGAFDVAANGAEGADGASAPWVEHLRRMGALVAYLKTRNGPREHVRARLRKMWALVCEARRRAHVRVPPITHTLPWD